MLHWLSLSLNAFNTQGWARWNQGARNSIQASHRGDGDSNPGTIACYPLWCALTASWNGEQCRGSNLDPLTWDVRGYSSGLPTVPHSYLDNFSVIGNAAKVCKSWSDAENVYIEGIFRFCLSDLFVGTPWG